ncbi:unnamed protein product [Peronospora belbahrii]|uniref:RxLR effector protein n=1 Tax=Peronospora belbahrii TaxID=622444 RepID=A0AAU9KXY2_9STRA|nr:unnamed protein product [Peronospora belbahrii]CAH0517175.1 unnamed protein product [Peronospora belbahrii]
MRIKNIAAKLSSFMVLAVAAVFGRCSATSMPYDFSALSTSGESVVSSEHNLTSHLAVTTNDPAGNSEARTVTDVAAKVPLLERVIDKERHFETPESLVAHLRDILLLKKKEEAKMYLRSDEFFHIFNNYRSMCRTMSAETKLKADVAFFNALKHKLGAQTVLTRFDEIIHGKEYSQELVKQMTEMRNAHFLDVAGIYKDANSYMLYVIDSNAKMLLGSKEMTAEKVNADLKLQRIRDDYTSFLGQYNEAWSQMVLRSANKN